MTETPASRLAVGVDVGGSGIKVAVVDVDRGLLVGPRLRVATPQPSTPEEVVPIIVRNVRRAVAETLAAGGLGTLLSARAEFGFPLAADGGYRWDPAMGGGALLDLGIYCLTPLLDAAGRPPIDVGASAVGTESGVDISFGGWLDFGEGLTGGFSVSFDSPERQLLELVGSEAILTAEGAFAPGPGGVVVRIQHRQGQVEEMKLPAGNPYRGMVDHFAAVVRGDETLRRPVAQSTEMSGLLDRQNEEKGP